MGRWAWKRFQTSGYQHLVIIMAYQASQHLASGLGMDTAFMQQWRILKQRSKDPANPRKAFWQDLSAKLSIFQSNGDEIFLMLNANSDSEDEDIIELTSYHGLFDLHTHIRDSAPPEIYRRARGKKKIDFMFGPHAILLSVTKGRILAYENGSKFSNHRGLYVRAEHNMIARFAKLK